MWYRFAGRQMGMITNNGGWEGSYAASVAQRQAAPATTAPGAFANGATVGKQEEQFSSNLEVINSYSQGSAAGSYVVRSGDSLQAIAQNLWGDSGLWYKLAEANGLSGAASLFEGQTLRLPAGVMRNTYNASSVTPYNPAETLGDVTPSTPQAVPPKKQKCGIAGQVLLVIIAVVVTYLTKGATKEFFAGVFKAMGASATTAAAAATAASHATAAAIGSTVSQAVGVATGIQEKFSWKEVGAAFVSGGVASHSKATTSVIDAIIQGAKNSAISQAINVTLGLQDKFSWAAVAAAGAGAGAGQWVGNQLGDAGSSLNNSMDRLSAKIGARATGFVAFGIQSGATLLANAVARSLIEGTDFGDNIRAALPDTIGNIIAAGLLGQSGDWTVRDPAPVLPDPADPDYQYNDPVEAENARLITNTSISLDRIASEDPTALGWLEQLLDAENEDSASGDELAFASDEIWGNQREYPNDVESGFMLVGSGPSQRPQPRPPRPGHNNPPPEQNPTTGVAARVPQQAIERVALGLPPDFGSMSTAEYAATLSFLKDVQENRAVRFIISQYSPQKANEQILTNPGFNLPAYYRQVLADFRQGAKPPTLGRYADMVRNARGQGVNVHHLNQDAAFGRVINRRDGLSILLTRSEHQAYHKSMNTFWRPYQRGGSLEGTAPTNAQYGAAQVNALQAAGFNQRQANAIEVRAAVQRVQSGLTSQAEVPRIPGRGGRR